VLLLLKLKGKIRKMGCAFKKTGHLASRLHYFGTMCSVAENWGKPVKNGTCGHPKLEQTFPTRSEHKKRTSFKKQLK
jgi:hypothetical protein